MNTTSLGRDAGIPVQAKLHFDPSLPEVHRSIPVPRRSSPGSGLRRALAFAGPGYLVAVGYMDPGNWATSIAGGSKFGFSLLSVIWVSSALAMLFQAAAVRLGVASGRDLAQACRSHLPQSVGLALWALAEIAIVACNLAEVLGMAIGLNMMFGIPLVLGVCITLVDVMLILALQRKGFRVVEAVVISLVFVIGACFASEFAWLGASVSAVAAGLLPHGALLSDPQMLYLAVGIVGATVMPHNLYLHSSVVQTRAAEDSQAGRAEAIKWATIDSTVALGLALLVNAAILILAACAFHESGMTNVAALSDAYRLLSPIVGVGAASAIFGIALLASGLSSSVTGTLAGQIVMEGFLRITISAPLRAFLTRLIAIVPAILCTAWYGTEGAEGLLVFSQVVLSIQLPFAIVPLLMFTTSKRVLGPMAFGPSMSAMLWIAAGIVIALNGWMILRMLG